MDKIELAVKYAQQGFSVIPLQPKEKKPLIAWAEHQERRATEEEIKVWWTTWPEANIGIVCGAISGNLAVVDVDPRNGGTVDGKEIPETPTVQTGGNGQHYYFLTDTPIKSGKPAMGIDLQAEGHYVVAPGSIHPSGKAYEWKSGLDLSVSIEKLPAWVTTAMVQTKPTAVPVSEIKAAGPLAELLKGVAMGRRNSAATQLSGYFLSRGIPVDIVFGNLVAWNKLNTPPLDETELKDAFESVLKIETRKNPSRIEEHCGDGKSFARPLSDLFKLKDQKIEYLVDRLLEKGANGFIGGEPKKGKSWLGLHIAMCLATGKPVFGEFTVPQKRKVLYIQEEDSAPRVIQRMEKLKGAGALMPDDEYFRQSIRQGFHIDDYVSRESLRLELMAFKPDLVVVDVFNSIHSKDDASQKEMAEIMGYFSAFQREAGCGFLILHHFRKTSGFGAPNRGNQRLRGSTVLAGWAENSLYVYPTRQGFQVEHESKGEQVAPFIYCLEDIRDGDKIVGVKLAYRGVLEKNRTGEKIDQLHEALLAAYKEHGPEGCTVKALMSVTKSSEGSIRKNLAALVEDQKIEVQLIKNAGGQPTKAYVPKEAKEIAKEDIEAA